MLSQSQLILQFEMKHNTARVQIRCLLFGLHTNLFLLLLTPSIANLIIQ